MNINFYKYQATGNDFILIDDREEKFNIKDSRLIKGLCKRRLGIGSDGLIILRCHPEYNFEMIFFNSTGERSTFCGNGARCIISFARDIGIISSECTFLAYDGVHQGRVDGENIMLRMSDVKEIDVRKEYVILDTGSPHLVKIVDNISKIDVIHDGRKLRYDERFGDYGINVNFTEIIEGNISMRTYERGDEMESLSCGTGSVATAIALYEIKKIDYRSITIKTRGGSLKVTFNHDGSIYTNIWLNGNVKLLYKGMFTC